MKMKRRILLDNVYELIGNKWISKDSMIDDTVRVIEGKLYYSHSIKLDEHDVCSGTKYTRVTEWIPLDDTDVS